MKEILHLLFSDGLLLSIKVKSTRVLSAPSF